MSADAPQPYPPPHYPPPGYQPPLSDADARLWATLAHLGGVLLSWVVPLVIWLVLRTRSRYVDEQGKEALNFQITLFIAYLITGLLIFVVIGIVLLPVVAILGLVFGILAAMAAHRGEAYRYPVALRIIT